MKKISVFVYMMFVVLFCYGCGCSIIEPGHVGIKVNNLGSERGVQNYTAKTGVVVFMPGVSSIFEYPTFVQTCNWTKHDEANGGEDLNEEISFNTKEGTVVSGDISLAFRLDPSKVPAFYVQFRSDDLATFAHGFLRNIARDAFNEEGCKYTLEEVYGDKKEKLITDVKNRINNQVTQYGVILEQFGFLGKIRMDPQIMAALNSKLTTTQNAIAAENRLREATANAANKVAAAKGEADANVLLANSITDKLVQWRQLEITQQAVAKWDGRRPMVEGSNTGMLLELPMDKMTRK